MGLGDYLSYSTARTVTLRDPCLGAVYYTFLLLIFLYIVVYNIVLNVGYLTFTTVSGSARVLTQQLTVKTDGVPCDPMLDTCDDVFPDVSQQPYCCPFGVTTGGVNQRLGNTSAPWDQTKGTCTWGAGTDHEGTVARPCEFRDGVGAETVYGESSFLTTAVHSTTQTYNQGCSITQGAVTCPKLWNDQPLSAGYPDNYYYYVVGPETFYVLLQHSVTAGDVEASSQKLNNDTFKAGYVYVPDDLGQGAQNELCTRQGGLQDPLDGATQASGAPCYYAPIRYYAYDLINAADMLTAAGLTLDASTGGTSTYRYDGLKLNVGVNYFNTWQSLAGGNPFISGRGTIQGKYQGLHYYYKFTEVKDSPVQIKQVFVTDPFAQTRTLISKHGILLQTIVAGSVGQFSALAILLQFTAGVALLATAGTAVNLLATWVMPNKAYYKRFMCQSTDMNAVMRCAGLSDEELEQVLLERNLPRGGDRVQKIITLTADAYAPTSSESNQEIQSSGTRPRPSDVERHLEVMMEQGSRTDGQPLVNPAASS